VEKRSSQHDCFISRITRGGRRRRCCIHLQDPGVVQRVDEQDDDWDQMCNTSPSTRPGLIILPRCYSKRSDAPGRNTRCFCKTPPRVTSCAAKSIPPISQPSPRPGQFSIQVENFILPAGTLAFLFASPRSASCLRTGMSHGSARTGPRVGVLDAWDSVQGHKNCKRESEVQVRGRWSFI
jgi:hypothetical protein